MAKNYITVTLDGSETAVAIPGGHCDIRNDGTDIVYISAEAGVAPDAEGVLSVPAGQSAKLLGSLGRVYLLGTGKVLLCGNDYADQVFKVAATSSGGGGTDEVARNAINALTPEVAQNTAAVGAVTETLTNPNLLINSDFRINQRGAAEYTGGYAVDRWTASNSVVSVGDEYITIAKQDVNLAAEMIQKVEMPFSALAGKSITISAILSDGRKITATGIVPEEQPTTTTAFVNASDYSLRFLWSAGGYYFFSILLLANKADPISVKKVKLEIGTISTIENDVCDKATELAKCQRYYQRMTEATAKGYGFISGDEKTAYVSVPIPVTMYTKPAVTIDNFNSIRCNGSVYTTYTDVSVITMEQGCVLIAITGDFSGNANQPCIYCGEVTFVAEY